MRVEGSLSIDTFGGPFEVSTMGASSNVRTPCHVPFCSDGHRILRYAQDDNP